MTRKSIAFWIGFLGVIFLSIFQFFCTKRKENPKSSTSGEHPIHETMPKEAPSHEHHPIAPSTPKKPEVEKKAKKVTYYCPMHPEYTSDQPGNCPICGMTLVPLEEKPQETTEIEQGSFYIRPVLLQKIGVTFGNAEYRNLTKEIRLFGRITYDETRIKEVNTKFSGWVETLFVDFTGRQVRKGDPLFSIYSPELVTAQEEYLLALSMKNQTPGFQEASLRKLFFLDFSPLQIQELEKMGKPTKTMTIFSPVDGFVIEKNVVQGQYITPEVPLYRIAELNPIWLVGEAYEQDIPFLSLGQKVSIELSFLNKKIIGTLSYISPYLDENTRTAEIRVSLPNPDFLLKSETYATVSIPVAFGKRLSIPEEAILISGERKIVFVDHGEGYLESREIETGVHAGEFIEVLSGLKPKERVVTSANFLIDSESKLKLALGKTHSH